MGINGWMEDEEEKVRRSSKREKEKKSMHWKITWDKTNLIATLYYALPFIAVFSTKNLFSLNMDVQEPFNVASLLCNFFALNMQLQNKSGWWRQREAGHMQGIRNK